MPISRNEFEEGQILTDIEKTIISFLEKNRNTAYTSIEIMDGINFQRNYSDLWKIIISGLALWGFPQILNGLVAKGKIKYNIIKGEYYYTAK